MISRRHITGNSFLTVMLLLSMVISAVFVMLLASRNSVIMANKMEARQKADQMAASAIALAVSKLRNDLSFQEDLKYEVVPDEIYGTISFTDANGAPYSTNNILSSNNKLGWRNTQVPPNFAYLVAVGHHHGMTVVRHAMIKQPLFPYSLAAGGRIKGENMEVFSVPSFDMAQGTIAEEDKLPGHIVANSIGDGERKSIALGTNTKISGDVRAVGQIDLAGDTVVQGQVLPNSSRVEIPEFDIDSYDPAGKDYTRNFQANATRAVGRNRYAGNLTVGDLELVDGLLYVDGDITLTGKIKGEGAIVATGNITVTGSMNTTSDLAALVSKKKVRIAGQGQDVSSFQGLIYARDSVEIRNTTVMGAIVSKDDAATTELENVTAVNVPELAQWDIEQHLTLEEAKVNFFVTHTGLIQPMGIQTSSGFVKLSPDGDTSALKTLAESLKGSPEGESTWQFGILRDGTFEPSPPDATSNFYSSKTNWRKYLDEVEEGAVIVVPIFAMDLNRLLSVSQNLELLYHNSIAD